MEVRIDERSGYCFGVEFAIQMAEDVMRETGSLYCLGDIVHNSMEVARLHSKGLKIIDRETLHTLRDCKVLIRAHGEPPETYQIATRNNIELIDASCPVVLKLQNRIKHSYDRAVARNGQVVIYGKEGHAEVIGLNGQTQNSAIIVSSIADLDKLDFSRPITLYSQTTKSTDGFYALKAEIENRIKAYHHIDTVNEDLLDANDSICRQVSNREPQMEKFSIENDVILFVSGKKSSNGKALYNVCLKNNPRSYLIENETEIQPNWFSVTDKIGICGATSTPMWLMEQVAAYIKNIEMSKINVN
jgi:4-hydroxy-3-methylbut-2-enyl diphosphate reductase